MVPKIATKRRSQREHLLHLAIVFKFELRLKIVAELYIRAMSPKGFFDELGGGPALPYSLQLAYSWSSFTAIARLLKQGLAGAFVDGRPSRGLTCSQFELDEIGWSRVIAKLDSDFESIFEEQEDAKIRCSCSGEKKLIRAGILQVGFESPRAEERLALCLADGSLTRRFRFPSAWRRFSLMSCVYRFSQLNTTDMSVKQFHREFAPDDASEGAVRYRFDRLRELAWIAVVDQVRKRAVYEKVYRATRPNVTANGAWAEASRELEEKEA